MPEREWKPFVMGEIFDIKDGYYNKKPPEDPDGKFPFLGATQSGNCITMFCNYDDVLSQDKVGNKTPPTEKGKIFQGPCITITNNGSVGYAYYQEHSFTCSHDVNPIYIPNKIITKELAMFLIPIIEQAGENFQYARKWRPKRMRKTRILLPTNEKGTPDWPYMENKISDTISRSQEKCLNFMLNELDKIGDFLECDLKKVKWQNYKVKDIFDILKVKGKSLSNYTYGPTPYISTSNTRNGVLDFIEASEEISSPKNVLSVDPINGTTFYHPYEFVGRGFAGSAVNLLHSKNMNEYTGLFLAKAIEHSSFKKATYGVQLNGSRLAETSILLPVNPNGQPDYFFMENYIKMIKANKIKEVIKFLD